MYRCLAIKQNGTGYLTFYYNLNGRIQVRICINMGNGDDDISSEEHLKL
jgi:hypothetical protein